MKHLNYLYYHKSSIILIVFFLGYFRIVTKCPFQWSILRTLFNALKNILLKWVHISRIKGIWISEGLPHTHQVKEGLHDIFEE